VELPELDHSATPVPAVDPAATLLETISPSLLQDTVPPYECAFPDTLDMQWSRTDEHTQMHAHAHMQWVCDVNSIAALSSSAMDLPPACTSIDGLLLLPLSTTSDLDNVLALPAARTGTITTGQRRWYHSRAPMRMSHETEGER
jgi:hypothetical protein